LKTVILITPSLSICRRNLNYAKLSIKMTVSIQPPISIEHDVFTENHAQPNGITGGGLLPHQMTKGKERASDVEDIAFVGEKDPAGELIFAC
jgi:hypothetical protein